MSIDKTAAELLPDCCFLWENFYSIAFNAITYFFEKLGWGKQKNCTL